jgi:hypothetical protein
MIKILKEWGEVIKCYQFFINRGIPHHTWFEKNWDNFQAHQLIMGCNKEPGDISLLELGYGGLSIYSMCKFLGVGRYTGVDLKRSHHDFLLTYLDYFKGRTPKRYRLIKGDLLKQRFREKFNLVICNSVIEHGINVASFFKACKSYCGETSLLFITFDYCNPKIDMSRADLSMVGGKWDIFCKDSVMEIIALAQKEGFKLIDKTTATVLNSNSPCVIDYAGLKYTFASILFTQG